MTTTNGHDPTDPGTGPTLADVLDDLAEDFGDVERRPTPVGVDEIIRHTG